MGYLAKLRVWRGDKAGGQLVDHEVEVSEGEVVLDIIHRLQATQAPDLAVRWNCKAGKCGSCSAEINGKPRLMCKTRLDDFAPGEEIVVYPIHTFPRIKDLVAKAPTKHFVFKTKQGETLNATLNGTVLEINGAAACRAWGLLFFLRDYRRRR